MVGPKARLAPAASAPFDLTYRDGEEKDMRRRQIFTKGSATILCAKRKFLHLCYLGLANNALALFRKFFQTARKMSKRE